MMILLNINGAKAIESDSTQSDCVFRGGFREVSGGNHLFSLIGMDGHHIVYQDSWNLAQGKRTTPTQSQTTHINIYMYI